MNNTVQQDHRFMKRLIRPGLGFGSYPTAWRAIQGYETMHMMRKGQIEGMERATFKARISSLQTYSASPQRLTLALSYDSAHNCSASILCNTTNFPEIFTQFLILNPPYRAPSNPISNPLPTCRITGHGPQHMPR